MPPRIAKKPAVPEPVDEAEKLKTQLRDALLEANESGKMNQVLEAHLDRCRGSMDGWHMVAQRSSQAVQLYT